VNAGQADNGNGRAWYLGLERSQVVDRALVVGDRGRVDRIASRLDNPTFFAEERGLRTVAGSYRGTPMVAAAFGMGAPIAAIVLEELASLGAKAVLRVGTAMALPPSKLGELLLAEAALTGESTSATYVPHGFPAVADFGLQLACRAVLERGDCAWRSGLIASYDGFYTEMLPLRPERRAGIESRVEELCRLGFLAMDMETSAVLAVGRALGLHAGALCLASVAWEGAARLSEAEREAGEELLVEVGLETLKGWDKEI
jgi:uridine phosphorylase